MGCLFGCFRIKDSRFNLVSSPSEPARSKSALSSLFLSDDESLAKEEEGQKPVPRKLDMKELKDKSEWEKWEVVHAQSREDKTMKLSSWFANASTQRLEKHTEGHSTAVKIKECATGLASFGSCMTERHVTGSFSSSTGKQYGLLNAVTPIGIDSETHSETSSVSPLPFGPHAKPTVKSVHFVDESDRSAFLPEDSSSECASQHIRRSGLAGNIIVANSSPYPTPLKLTEEMQTPGSEYPAINRGHAAYSVPNSVENSSQWKTLDEECSSYHVQDSLKSNDEESLLATPTVEPAVEHHSAGKDTDSEGSLSSWFKPVSVKQDNNKKTFSTVSIEKVAKTSGDRPILGMVAAYWNDDKTSQTPPKWWDGNGIPNSTNKYKEDQKVSWHATPFEERLEKALTEETFVSQRKPISSSAPPVDFNEAEESDTALSRLQSNHAKPVVSF